MKNLPFEYIKYLNEPARFFTYYGTVYYGCIVNHSEIDGIFIVPRYNLKDALEPKQSHSSLSKLGHFIGNLDVIVDVDQVMDVPREIDDIPIIYDPRRKFSRMLIFGAGASSFCLTKDEMSKLSGDDLRPPLGTELFDERFDERLKHYPGAEALIPSLELGNNHIEQVIQNEWKHITSRIDNVRMANLISTQYYLHDLFIDVSKNIYEHYKRRNLHSHLIQEVKNSLQQDEGILVVSFNYDTLVESAIHKCAGQRFDQIADYANFESQFCVFKPHGSSNWGWKFSSPDFHTLTRSQLALKLFEDKTDLHSIYYSAIGQTHKSIHKRSFAYEADNSLNGIGYGTLNKELIEVVQRQDKYFPAILVPFAEKDELLMPYSHHIKLDVILSNIQEIVCIGWKGNERVFNQRLFRKAKRLERIIIVDPDWETVESNLRLFLDQQSVEVEHINGFEEYVAKLSGKT